MTNLEINQTIHKARGLCWHEWVQDPRFIFKALECGKCAQVKTDFDLNPSYTSSWEDYGELLEWAQGEGWWIKFTSEMPYIDSQIDGILDKLLNPLRGSTAIAEFIVGHPESLRVG